MDLSHMSGHDLQNLQDQIKLELKSREKQEILKAREQILAIAQGIGIQLEKLTQGMSETPKRKKSINVATTFVHPRDATLQWPGKGRHPKWVKDWLQSGGKMEQLRP